MSGSTANQVVQTISQIVQKANLFAPNSRYFGQDPVTLESPDGKVVRYLTQRFSPSSDNLVVVQEYTVVDGDRLDNLAAKYLGDPELYWRICDANDAMKPEELIAQVGRKLRITLPNGISGAGRNV